MGAVVARRMARLGQEVGLLLFVVLLCPVAILVVGAPVVLLVRLLIEIAGRL